MGRTGAGRLRELKFWEGEVLTFIGLWGFGAESSGFRVWFFSTGFGGSEFYVESDLFLRRSWGFYDRDELKKQLSHYRGLHDQNKVWRVLGYSSQAL